MVPHRSLYMNGSFVNQKLLFYALQPKHSFETFISKSETVNSSLYQAELLVFLRDWASNKKSLSHNLLGLDAFHQQGLFIWCFWCDELNLYSQTPFNMVHISHLILNAPWIICHHNHRKQTIDLHTHIHTQLHPQGLELYHIHHRRPLTKWMLKAETIETVLRKTLISLACESMRQTSIC